MPVMASASSLLNLFALSLILHAVACLHPLSSCALRLFPHVIIRYLWLEHLCRLKRDDVSHLLRLRKFWKNSLRPCSVFQMDTSRVTYFVHLQAVRMPTCHCFKGTCCLHLQVILTECRRFLRNLGSRPPDCVALQGKPLSINL